LAKDQQVRHSQNQKDKNNPYEIMEHTAGILKSPNKKRFNHKPGARGTNPFLCSYQDPTDHERQTRLA
jgi:hypothetical protein